MELIYYTQGTGEGLGRDRQKVHSMWKSNKNSILDEKNEIVLKCPNVLFLKSKDGNNKQIPISSSQHRANITKK